MDSPSFETSQSESKQTARTARSFSNAKSHSRGRQLQAGKQPQVKLKVALRPFGRWGNIGNTC